MPELVDGWPPMRDLDGLLRDAQAARANVSAVWDSIMFEGTHGSRSTRRRRSSRTSRSTTC